MIFFGHVAGVPVEELLPSAGGIITMMLAARAWIWLHFRRRK